MKIISNILLFPLSLLYGGIMWFRNILYKSNFIGSTDFEIPVISIGNLSVGGTGKTPFTEWLIELFHGKYQTAVLSRGYKRKTSGYLNVNTVHTINEVGDEPLMLKLKYPDVAVSVGEQRVFAIPRLLSEQPDTQVILLDDAFQHQSVRPDINILLTTYDKPFYEDAILPLGTLRESVSGKNRANIIVVTKCPENLSEEKQSSIYNKIHPEAKQKVFFSTVIYDIPYNLWAPAERLAIHSNTSHLLLTGIANASPLKNYIKENAQEVIHFNFNDHHVFEQHELESIKKNYPAFNRWITTEKDGVRLALHKNWFLENGISLFCIPIKTRIIGKNKEDLENTILGYLDYFYQEKPEPRLELDSIPIENNSH